MTQGLYPDEGDRSVFRPALLDSWQRVWHSSPQGIFFFALQPTVSFSGARWAISLPRWDVSVLAGMRLNNSVLRVHLCRAGIVPLCDCGVDESIEHFWMRCHRYVQARCPLISVFQRVFGRTVIVTVPVLLNFMSYTRYSQSRCELRQALLRFLRDTDRFSES